MPDLNQAPSLERIVDELRAEFAATAEHYDRTAAFPFANFDRLSPATAQRVVRFWQVGYGAGRTH